MKRIIFLMLVLILLLSLSGCGSPALPGLPAPAPEEAAGDAASSSASTVSEDPSPDPVPVSEPDPAPAPSRDIIEVTIDADNFYDYFEFVEFPENRLSIETDPNGNRTRIIASSGFYLKEEYEIAEERAGECAVRARAEYMRNAYYYTEKSIYIHLDDCSYEIRKKTPNSYSTTSHDDELESAWLDGQFFLYIGSDTVLNANFAKIIGIDGLKLSDVSGTLYLYR